ncbi:MAG TPA: hypothetical protein DCO86_05535 [Spirochaetaceae bacterium]|nr:hypothetical protein [Spirochaetaceae bacterium]
MTLSQYEYGMELLAAMVCKTIAEQKKIPPIEAFDSFIKSETAKMLFDERTAFWCNGPDYIADEYNKEISVTDIQSTSNNRRN